MTQFSPLAQHMAQSEHKVRRRRSPNWNLISGLLLGLTLVLTVLMLALPP